jgi:hypothetical protein
VEANPHRPISARYKRLDYVLVRDDPKMIAKEPHRLPIDESRI